MLDQIVSSTLGAASAAQAAPPITLPVSPGAAWTLILSVLGFSAVALWLLRDTPAHQEKPKDSPSYREAA